jgi:2,3-bisphosphoglycerate-dependent phosphoglycerate mutase
VDAIYASTMARARETAAAACAAYPTPIQFDDRLREIGNNRLDHAPWPPDALPVEYSNDWASARPFASVLASELMGESYMHFRTRVGIFIEEAAARHRGQTLLVICHGGVVDAAFDHIFNVGPWRRCEVWDHNTAVTYFEYVEHPGREVWRLHFHNRVEHLVE